MPRLSQTEEERRNAQLVATIKYNLSLNHLSNKKLATKLQIGERTLYDKLNCAEEFRLRELRVMAKLFNTTLGMLLSEKINERGEAIHIPHLSLTEEEGRDAQLVATIKYHLSLNHLSNKKLAEKLQIGETTLYEKLDCAEDFRLRELRLMAKLFNITLGTFLSGKINERGEAV